MNMTGLYGPSFFELGQGPLFQQCRMALVWITAGNQERCDLPLNQFAYFLAMCMESTNILASRKLEPALVWAQVDDRDMRYLANVLV